MLLTLLLIVSVVLVGAALADGFSTVHFLKNTEYMEMNPLLGSHPSTLRVFGEGMGITAAEIAAAFLLAHLRSSLGCLIMVGGLIQSGLHIHYAVKNSKIPLK